ncbi:PPE family protein [Mycobacterium decipiens]|uniref:PPE family protein n=1 Tax=Mycobacterium decipiens TaxID=1430326 RepID=A0A1X2M102_9MYCO|nr:PPE family protein [Mycobacterium decipiens]OSC43211.1 hypothetical protein B8W66_02200 [Mycobacterium decipiens]
MDFALLPPEVNSARMYTGPGSGSMLAAAGSWDALAAELGTTAETYGSVISGLSSLNWRGPASELMTATAAPYIGWLYATAEQTQQTAFQARAAAMAFEQAHAMTVPPPLVAANRTQLLTLIATNFFGQNTAAIAALEAQYAEMWAQDAAAMYGYATAAATAAQLTPFSAPQQTTDPAGIAAQSAAVDQAVGSAQVIDVVSQLIASLLQQIPGLPPIVPDDFTFLDEVFAVYATVGVTQDLQSMVSGLISTDSTIQGMLGSSENPAELAPLDFGIGSFFSATSPAGAVSASGGGAGLGNAVLASVGRAGSIGQLSVPPSWAAPSARTVAALSPAGLTTLPGTDVAEHGMPGVPGVPVAAGRASGVLPRYGVRLTVMAHPPAAG